MKQVIAIALLAMALVAGAGAAAQGIDLNQAKAEAGITPDSGWYPFKVLAEEVWANVLGALSWGAEKPSELKISYLNRIVKKRRAEALVMLHEKGERSAEFQEALGRKTDLERELLDTIAESHPAQYEAILKDRFGGNLQFTGELIAAQERARRESGIDDLRKRLAEARRLGDGAKATALLEELEAAKGKYFYDERLVTRDLLNTIAEVTAEQIEDMVTRTAKYDLLLQAAEARKREALAQGAEIGQLDQLISQAKQAVAEAKEGEADAAVRDLRKSIQKTGGEIRKLSLAKEAEQRLADKAVVNPPKAPAAGKTVVEKPKPPVAPPKPVAPKPAPPKPVLKPIPSESVRTAPLQLIYFPNLNGQVDTEFSVEYSAQGGLPPYHFQLETMGGFPPIGTILDLNGRLSGTPKSAGNSRFKVCAVDTAGISACEFTVMVVAPAPPPPPEPEPAPQIDAQMSITNQSATITEDKYRWWVCYRDISGTANGPVGTFVGGSPTSDSLPGGQCGAWSKIGASACERQAGEPEQTQWTFSIPGGIPGSGDSRRRQVMIRAPDYELKTESVHFDCHS